MPTPEELKQGFRIGEWDVLPARRVLRRGDEEIAPEPKVWAVLMALAERDGDVVTRDQLVDEVWDSRPTGDEPINRCISQLRKHLGDTRPYRYIRPVTGSGYQLQAGIELLGDEAAEPSASGALSRRGPSLALAAIVAVVIVVAGLAWLFRSPPPDEAIDSIVVLPFENVGGDPADQYLASGFRDEFAATLARIPDFAVKTGRQAYTDQSASEIASLFAVDSVLRGQVQRSGEELKVNYEVSHAGNGQVVSADVITDDVRRVFDIQERLARRLRDDLFGADEQQLVSASRPSNFEAYNTFLQGTYAFERRGNANNLEDAIELFEQTIELDPSFGPAYLQLAAATALLPAYRGADIGLSSERAIEIVEAGIASDGSITEAAAAVRGFVYHNLKQWAEAELAYEKATQASIVDPNAFNWYSRMLASVGRLDAALDKARAAVEMAPDSAVINSRVALAYSWLDDAERAQRYFDRAQRLGAEGATHLLGYALFLARQGEIEQSRRVARRAAAQAGRPPEWIDAVLAGLEDPEQQAEALAVVEDAVAAGQLNSQIEIVVRTLLGDIDGAMVVAERLREPGEAFEMDLLWIPEFEPLRRHPRFMTLMRFLGVAGYWALHGCEFVDAAVRCPEDA